MTKWTFRQSKLYPNYGVNYRYVQQECLRHGMTEHSEIENGSSICRSCCRDRQKRPKKIYAQITSNFYS